MGIKTRSIRYNFIMNFLLTASNFIFPLITFPYITRVLQSTGTGSVSFVTSVTNYFLMVANLGIPTYGIRACARVRDDKIELSKVTHEILIINTVTTFLSVATFVISILFVPQFKEEEELFFINGIGMFLNLFSMQWLYQALEKYDYITFRSLIVKVISIILMFIFVKQESDYIIYGAIGVFAAAGANVLNLIHARHYISFRPLSGYQFRRHIKPIFVLFAQTLVVSIYTNLDIVMLGFMKDNSEVGLYTAAVKVKTILVSLVSSLSMVLLPKVSNAVKNNDKQQFDELTKMSINFTSFIAIPLSIYFCIFSKESILLLAGDGFLGAVSAMQIVTIAIIPIGLTGVLGIQILTSMEKEKYVLYSVIVGAVSDFVLNLVFIPMYGSSGAAFATMIAEFLVLFVQLYYTRRIIFPALKQLRMLLYGIATVVSVMSSLVIMYFLNIENVFLILFVSACIFFGTYLIVLLIFREPMIVQYTNKLKVYIKNFSKRRGE